MTGTVSWAEVALVAVGMACIAVMFVSLMT